MLRMLSFFRSPSVIRGSAQSVVHQAKPASMDSVHFGMRNSSAETSTERVELKNGSSHPKPLVKNTLAALKLLQDQGGIPGGLAVIDLVMKCKKGDAYRETNSNDLLREGGFLKPNGQVLPEIKDIVLSATEGDDYRYKFVSPFKES